MTLPRQILPGQIYLVTRRCTQRQFLLRPDETTTRIFQYTLGEAATRFGIELLAWHASSNHYHAVVYDPSGNLPLFLERFHKLCARALNARWKRWENVWAAEATCAVRLIEDADVLEKVVYTLANPITDQLVERVFDWPGANSLRYTRAAPRTILVERPRIFFREGGPLPKTVQLQVAVPPSNTRPYDADCRYRLKAQGSRTWRTHPASSGSPRCHRYAERTSVGIARSGSLQICLTIQRAWRLMSEQCDVVCLAPG